MGNRRSNHHPERKAKEIVMDQKEKNMDWERQDRVAKAAAKVLYGIGHNGKRFPHHRCAFCNKMTSYGFDDNIGFYFDPSCNCSSDVSIRPIHSNEIIDFIDCNIDHLEKEIDAWL